MSPVKFMSKNGKPVNINPDNILYTRTTEEPGVVKVMLANQSGHVFGSIHVQAGPA